MLLASLLFFALLSQAAPQLLTRSIRKLSPSQVAELAPYTQFARAAYCPTRVLSNWSCGQACSALSGFQPSLVGGDGNAIQNYIVGYWPNQDAVVVAHEGTDPTKLLSVLTDVKIRLVQLDPTLFPGVSSAVLVHEGFRNEHAQTASKILAQVKILFAQHNTNKLRLIGHSLGGAIAELDSLFFATNIPGIRIKTVTYGTPRVGNAAFAHLIDLHIPDFHRVNNEKDVIPTVPAQFLGFSHPHGEIHILSHFDVVACSGDDDSTDPECTDKTVPILLKGNILNHLGPYDGIYIGTVFCY
ncbi:hypothetical protein APHAL10511_004858 [Amanita phalloides]|nr:hypothetical protein APHAL10511_004858 [Amanita phalloides]